MAQDYGSTLNLPKTDFPMRGNLPAREPEFLEKWEKLDLYNELLKRSEGKPTFILHDGPPYANGDIHLGHALNKILKDIVNKHKILDGYRVPYVPGWDTHGLPIERQAIKKLGIKRNEVSNVEFRKVCKDFAIKYVTNQREQFKRLGVVADWENPYITLNPDFEAKQIEIFGTMAEKGYIYKGLKPVIWCPECETALAEAEIEYQDDDTNSIYVKFKVTDDLGKFGEYKDNAYFVIWTTTTWSLPGNVAIAVNPRFEYSLVKIKDTNEIFVIATDLIEAVQNATGFGEYEVVKTFAGADFENMKCAHPFLNRDSLLIEGEHVTLDAGTGCVHTAPGHGAEDYIACKSYDLPMIVPVDDRGYMNEHAGQFNGLKYDEACPKILDQLKSTNNLLGIELINHSYPHCWRCKSPIVYRATDQWFASVDGFKKETLDAIKEVKWIPAWGEDRISSMVSERSDWCISRQRLWGVPIPVFYCEDCKKPIMEKELIARVAEIFSKEGADSWFAQEADYFLPEGFKCGCGCTSFTKETDTMDVWFDSGSSHEGVISQREGMGFPADMYLEGNDQYRGWFQSSLLTSVAKCGKAPYKTVLTHGFVIDEEKRKMSKSAGNGLPPLDIIKEYGADILRLWVSSADYKSDIKISKDLLKQLSEVYRKIRNTARYILGSISDFNPDTDMVTDFEEIDTYILIKLNKLIEKVSKAYEEYEYHIMYHAIHNFCVVDLSNFYLDVVKDRTYCEKADSKMRRSAQSAMYLILDALVKMLAPVLSFTGEEIWQFMPHKSTDDAESIWFNSFPQADSSFNNAELEEKWDKILELKSEVAKALEAARAEKIIGSSLVANVDIYAEGNYYDFLKSIEENLVTVLISSSAKVGKLEEAPADAVDGENLKIKVKVTLASGEKCERCWMISETTGKKIAGLCERCANVIE